MNIDKRRMHARASLVASFFLALGVFVVLGGIVALFYFLAKAGLVAVLIGLAVFCVFAPLWYAFYKSLPGRE